MWQTLIWTISLPAQALIGGAVIWLYNLATGNSLSEFIGMIVTHGYTQGPGQAYAFGTLWEKGGIADCATVGVIYAALGFLSAAIVGVPSPAGSSARASTPTRPELPSPKNS